ncbi:MAG: transferase hexapeptide repeat containing protein [Microcoleus sp. SU_5_3]|nr:transferase hexapeptide repeat containing protein [Microcoleus sp. SU_5_3]
MICVYLCLSALNLRFLYQSKIYARVRMSILLSSISDKSAFLEALEYGRAFRQADKPNDEDCEPA